MKVVVDVCTTLNFVTVTPASEGIHESEVVLVVLDVLVVDVVVELVVVVVVLE